MSHSYAPPVDELLTFGYTIQNPDLVELYGFTSEHVPELIRLATDRTFDDADSASNEVWAPMHAWRALAELRAAEAAEPLVQRLATLEDDWAHDLGTSIARIGAPAYEPLLGLLRDTTCNRDNRGLAASALGDLGAVEPDLRDACVAVLADVLANEPAGPMVDAAANGLLDLEAVEAAPAFQRALEDGRLDVHACGDWEDVQIELGLLDQRITPPPPSLLEAMIRKEYADRPEEGARLLSELQDPERLARLLARAAEEDSEPVRRPDVLIHVFDHPLREWDAPAQSQSRRSPSAAARRKAAKQSRKKNRRKK